MITLTAIFAFMFADVPSLKVDRSTIDLGTVRSGVTQTVRFVLTNTTVDTIDIGELRPSCGCLRVSIGSRKLGASETTYIEMLLHTLTQPPGPNRWRIVVPYRETELALEVTANIVREIEIEPSSLVIPFTPDRTFTVLITDRRTTPFRIVGVKSTLPFVIADWTTKIDVRVVGEVPIGDHHGTIVIQTDDAAYREIEVPIEVRNRPKSLVSVTPSELSLRMAKGQTLASGIVQIRRGDDGEVKIAEVTTDAKNVTTNFGSGRVVAVRVRVNAESDGKGEVRIRLLEPMGEEVIVPVMWKRD